MAQSIYYGTNRNSILTRIRWSNQAMMVVSVDVHYSSSSFAVLGVEMRI